MSSEFPQQEGAAAPGEGSARAEVRIRFPWPFFVFAAVGLVGVWLLSAQRPSFEAFAQVRPALLALTFGVAVLAIGLDAVRLQILMRLARTTLPFLQSVRIVLVYAFFSAVTPTSLGGEVSMVWLLARRGLKPGAAAAVTGIRTLLPIVVALAALPVFALARPEDFHGFLRIAIPVVAVVCVMAVVMFLLVVAARELIRRRMRRARTVGGSDAVQWGFVRRVLAWLDITVRDSWGLVSTAFSQQPLVLLGAALVTVAQVLAYLSIVPLCAVAVGAKPPFWQTVAGAAVVELLVVFVPTPGGSGASEAGIGAVLKRFVPGAALVWTVLLWRLIATHLRVLSGAILTAGLIHGLRRGKPATDRAGKPAANVPEAPAPQ